MQRKCSLFESCFILKKKSVNDRQICYPQNTNNSVFRAYRKRRTGITIFQLLNYIDLLIFSILAVTRSIVTNLGLYIRIFRS